MMIMVWNSPAKPQSYDTTQCESRSPWRLLVQVEECKD